MQKPFLSIIIPTLNEEGYILKTLDNIHNMLSGNIGYEIIVVDAGSTDQTVSLAQTNDIRIEVRPEFKGCKYKSLNYGAELSKGEALFFLDADSQLPVQFDQFIQNALDTSQYVGGAFEYKSENRSISFQVIELINRLRYRVDGLYFGDQGIFCKRQSFFEVGGYPDEPIMEASFLCRRLKKVGKLKLIKEPLVTSTRRFETQGKWRVFFNDMIIWMRFIIGISVEEYGAEYWKLNDVKRVE
ncbi:MAG: TIGR04283 family arsenosugar biosynthesis glycosyltransferase [Cyclobacteriaceae bacterium]